MGEVKVFLQPRGVFLAVFPGELEDPIGQPRAVYEACALRIRAWAAELVREAL